ncbi:HxlR family transcriptional regulator [Paenibacillus cellulosilyticus]|uniref:HxlR family transcriptional regulator n=1 Tax=Paenibacillus cellulosilyticus TaxID=375489 RepID=A0A2V2YN83_9BACL|nr:helix-turn-helix domain-containing protein [Paenibacillus cellulosilyticus]PWV95882.1 HxlR family transcriptional regulator [Paenibacillus cellulosilyticus]QKS47751.1 helix-turn-helix transcriptional regulator [Paenibacillus cellulosilyticus]
MTLEQHPAHGDYPDPGENTAIPNICEALSILGAKWSFMVIAQLSGGPQRFKQLLRNVKVVKTQSLTDTLRHLEATGVVRREVFPTIPVTVEYSLTRKGHDFRRVIDEMEQWVEKWKPKNQDNL